MKLQRSWQHVPRIVGLFPRLHFDGCSSGAGGAKAGLDSVGRAPAVGAGALGGCMPGDMFFSRHDHGGTDLREGGLLGGKRARARAVGALEDKALGDSATSTSQESYYEDGPHRGFGQGAIEQHMGGCDGGAE